jgi:phosphoenolpyruvate carboxykinase (GTP)
MNMSLLTRMGTSVLNVMSADKFFLPCLHSVGAPLVAGKADVKWPCNPDNTHIALFPDDPSVMSFGSAFGANAFMATRIYGLRMASTLAKKEGWMAEHCLILGVTSPENVTSYICAGFQTGCGKSNLATVVPTTPGWRIRCVGDDIAWLHTGSDGALYAINPMAGFFDRVDGLSYAKSRAIMDTLRNTCIFTNVALTDNGDVWWEGMTRDTPAHLIDWTGNDWTPSSKTPPSHLNGRYTALARNCVVMDEQWQVWWWCRWCCRCLRPF